MPGIISSVSNAIDTGIMGQGGLNNGEPYEKEMENSRQLAEDKASARSGPQKGEKINSQPLKFQNPTVPNNFKQAGNQETEKNEKDDASTRLQDNRSPRARLLESKNRQKKEARELEESKKLEASHGFNSFKLSWARILYESWKSVPETGGLSIPLVFIWIHVHWGLSILWPKIYCSPGEEWFLANPVLKNTIQNEADLKRRSVMARILEKALIIFVDLLIFSLFLIFLTLIKWYINLNIFQKGWTFVTSVF